MYLVLVRIFRFKNHCEIGPCFPLLDRLDSNMSDFSDDDEGWTVVASKKSIRKTQKKQFIEMANQRFNNVSDSDSDDDIVRNNPFFVPKQPKEQKEQRKSQRADSGPMIPPAPTPSVTSKTKKKRPDIIIRNESDLVNVVSRIISSSSTGAVLIAAISQQLQSVVGQSWNQRFAKVRSISLRCFHLIIASLDLWTSRFLARVASSSFCD